MRCNSAAHNVKKVEIMSKGNLVSGFIPQDIVDKVNQKQKEILDLLSPYEVTISEAEKKRIPKASDELMPFLEKGMLYLKSDDKYRPQFVNAKEIDNDYQRAKLVNSMKMAHQKVQTLLNNLGIVSKSDLYAALLEYYNNVQRAANKGDARAKAIADDLGKSFNRSSKTGNSDTSGA